MKKSILLAFFLLGLGYAPAAHAQFTQVTGTITDPSGLPYSYGTISASLIPATTGNWQCNSQGYTGQIPTTNLDINGKFAASMCPNALVSPAGSQWVFSVSVPGVPPPLGFGAVNFTATLTITGTSEDIGAALSALAPAMTRNGGGGGGGGSVTSVGLALPNIFSISNSPVIGVGTLTGTFNIPGPNYSLISTSANAAAFEQINGGSSCGDGVHALSYNASTHVFGCQALTTGAAGTVTSVALALPGAFSVSGSPVSVSGTLTGAFNVAGADYMLTSTAANVAGFQQINSGSSCGDGSHALSYSTSTHTIGCQAISAGTGSVTSVALSLPSVFSVGGSPITAAGTLAGTFNVTGSDYLLTSTAANAAAFELINGGSSCGDGVHAVSYNASTHIFGCQALTTGAGGTVTSVALALPGAFSVSGSPVSVTGTLTGAFNVAGADYMLTSTAANVAGFQQINSGSSCGDGSHALSYNTGTHTIGCQAISAGTGSVTSVALSLPSVFSISGSPVTAAGTLSALFNVAASDYLLTSTAANAGAFEQINGGSSCGDGVHAISYSTSTHTFGCQALTAAVNPMTTIGDLIYGSTNGSPSVPARLAGPTGPNNVTQFMASTPVGGVAAAPVWDLPGTPVNSQTGTSYTVAPTDRFVYIAYNNGSGVAVTLAQAGSTGFASNFTHVAANFGAGSVTYTPTTSTINGSATLVIPQNHTCAIYSDNTNYFASCNTGQ
jgi:hypothetical protein